ncbi:MAG: HPr family phosphocarrier protein [Lachnospiraceae bacterium]|nr:HPr family phosphocarrier protein [Lachnospiraceae bacterium]
MVVKELEVLNELGLHARVACRINRSLGAYESSFHVVKEGQKYDLKTVTGVIMTNAKQGDVLTVEVEGADEDTGAEALEKLFAEKFGER